MKPKPRKTIIATGEVPLPELREYLGLDPRRLQQLVDEGVVVKAGRGRYALKDSVRGYIEYLRKNRPGKSDSLNALREEKLRIENVMAMQEALRQWGEVTEDAALSHELVPVFKSFQVSMRELPSVMANKLWLWIKQIAPTVAEGKFPDQEGVAQVKAELQKPVHDRLRKLSVLGDWKNRRRAASPEAQEK